MRHIELINSMKREKNNMIPLATVKTKKKSMYKNVNKKIMLDSYALVFIKKFKKILKK